VKAIGTGEIVKIIFLFKSTVISFIKFLTQFETSSKFSFLNSALLSIDFFF
tara:strand:- start:364 stop:516 length:153 start_codon:yes stop_codon:yes gene_type:complete